MSQQPDNASDPDLAKGIALAELADGGRLVMPVEREPGDQRLVQVTRHGDELVEADLGAVRFVPLIGDQGWPDQGGQR